MPRATCRVKSAGLGDTASATPHITPPINKYANKQRHINKIPSRSGGDLAIYNLGWQHGCKGGAHVAVREEARRRCRYGGVARREFPVAGPPIRRRGFHT